MVGANAVQVGTANFYDPTLSARLVDELAEWCTDQGLDDVNELVGTPGENKIIRVAILNATGDEWVGDVGLLQYVDENDGPPVYKPSRVQTGDVALVFVTNDMLQVYEEVREAGYTIIAPPMNPAGQSGPDAPYEFMFFDRDGIIVNLIQRAK